MRDKKISLIIAVGLAVVMTILLFSICAEAKAPRNGKVTDACGNTYIYKHGKLQTGDFWYNGRWYYGHKTKSACYPAGSIAKNTYRVRNGKMYYYDEKGRKITKSTRYIKLRRGRTSIAYIYPPASDERFNARNRTWERRIKGKWKRVGMQVWPYGWIDWQY